MSKFETRITFSLFIDYISESRNEYPIKNSPCRSVRKRNRHKIPDEAFNEASYVFSEQTMLQEVHTACVLLPAVPSSRLNLNSQAYQVHPRHRPFSNNTIITLLMNSPLTNTHHDSIKLLAQELFYSAAGVQARASILPCKRIRETSLKVCDALTPTRTDNLVPLSRTNVTFYSPIEHVSRVKLPRFAPRGAFIPAFTPNRLIRKSASNTRRQCSASICILIS